MTQRLLDILGRPEFLIIGGALAAFLVLTWIVRGAPIGQSLPAESGEAPSASRRDGLVTLAVLGFLLVLVGAVVAFRYGIPWSLPFFAVGIGLVLWSQRASRPYRHASPTLRRVAAFGDAALTITLVGGILVVGNVAAFKYGGRPLDFTRDEAFTLSSLSLNQIKSLARPLRVTLVMGQDRRSARHRERVRGLVRLYREANPEKVASEEVDPYLPAHRATYEDLARRVPDLNVVPGDAIVLEYGGDGGPVDRSVIAVSDLSREAPGPNGGSLVTTFTGEDAITSTIARFREGKRTPVGFLTGHGEPSIAEMDPRLPGLGLWKARLASLGLDAAEVDLSREDVAAAVPLVIIVAPKTPLQAPELPRLEVFLRRGGTLLVLANNDDVGLGGVLARLNVAYEKGTIVDERANLGYPTDVVTPPLPRIDHPLVATLAGEYFIIPASSPLKIVGAGAQKPGEPAEGPNPNPAMVDFPFLRTSQFARAVTTRTNGRLVPDRANDPKGPFVVGVAVSERGDVAAEGKTRPRAVVLSSPLMAVNPYFPSSNADLLMNAVQWLRGKSESSGGVAPRVQAPLVFSADPNLRIRLHLVPTVLMVVLIVGFGATTYLARRS